MKNVKFVAFLVSISLGISSLAQEATDSAKQWSYGGEAGLSFSQLSLTNWNAGGLSSVALNGFLRLSANYKSDHASWDNSFESGYGFIRRDGENTIKSDDQLAFSSQYNKNSKRKHLSYSFLLNFNTQYTAGYNYPNDSVAISNFLAPAYLNYSVGMSYKPSENFNLLFAPAAGKTTFVMEESLSAAGAFGVEPGQQIRNEVGAFLKSMMKFKLMDNITFESRLTLFSNYLKNPQNIDVNWNTFLSMKVNSLISVSVTTELIYDDDIKIAVDDNDDGVTDSVGPRIQFKELLGIGISYKF